MGVVGGDVACFGGDDVLAVWCHEEGIGGKGVVVIHALCFMRNDRDADRLWFSACWRYPVGVCIA